MNVIMKPQPIPQTRFIRFTHEGPAGPRGTHGRILYAPIHNTFHSWH